MKRTGKTTAVKTNDGNGVRYRGVRKMKSGRYYAEISERNARFSLGSYDTPEAAARAYDERAVELRGAKAKTNFPLGPYHNSNKGPSASHSTIESSRRDLNLGSDSISSRFPFPKIQVKSGTVLEVSSESESLSAVMDTSTEGGRCVVFDFDLNSPPPPEN